MVIAIKAISDFGANGAVRVAAASINIFGVGFTNRASARIHIAETKRGLPSGVVIEGILNRDVQIGWSTFSVICATDA